MVASSRQQERRQWWQNHQIHRQLSKVSWCCNVNGRAHAGAANDMEAISCAQLTESSPNIMRALHTHSCLLCLLLMRFLTPQIYSPKIIDICLDCLPVPAQLGSTQLTIYVTHRDTSSCALGKLI